MGGGVFVDSHFAVPSAGRAGGKKHLKFVILLPSTPIAISFRNVDHVDANRMPLEF